MNSSKTFISGVRILAICAALSQTVWLAPLSVQAADNEIKVAGQSVFAITSPADGMSAEQRAETIQRNLDNAIVASKDHSSSSVNIVYVKGTPVVTLGGYQVLTVGADAAKASGTTAALLAQNFADSLRQALSDGASIDSYIGQLTGKSSGSMPPLASQPYGADPGFVRRQPQGAYPADYSTYRGQYQSAPEQGPSQPPYRGKVTYLPAGLTLPVVLRTSISTQAARPGDMVTAQINQPVNLGDSVLPSGAIVTGTITQADPGRRLNRSGNVGIKFTSIRTPDGVETPIAAHIVGEIGKYKQLGSDQSGVVKGEGWGTKAGQFALRSAVGAGAGAALGTAVGAIAAQHGRGVGRGAWSGAAIGGGIGMADALILRKGKEVNLQAGQILQLQLDAPAQISGSGASYTGAF